MKTIAKRLLAILVGTFVGFSCVPASASESPAVDPARLGSLTVHKYLVPKGGSIEAGRPAQGVEFTIARVVDIDLSSAEGWRQAQVVVDSVDPSKVSVGDDTSRVADADGTAYFADVPIGLYRVAETVAAAGNKPAAPFFVTVPMRDPADPGAWLYDVHVYPKSGSAFTPKPPTPKPSKTPRHSYAPGDSEAADTGAAPAAVGTSNAGQPASYDSKGSLPVTGAAIGLLIAIAGLLVGLGASVTTLARRRYARRFDRQNDVKDQTDVR